MCFRSWSILGALGISFLIAVPTKVSAEVPTFTITIRDHRFEPAELSVPANEKFKLVIQNEDPSEEEFESYELNREEVVDGGDEITVFIGPLKPGSYEYFGDFHQETAQGVIKAVEAGDEK